MSIAAHIVGATQAGGLLSAIEFEGETLSWSALAEAIVDLDQLLSKAGLDENNVIGLLGCNRLEALAGFIVTLGTGRGLLLLNAIRPAGLIAFELSELQLCCLLASEQDLSREVLLSAAQSGALVICVRASHGKIAFSTVGERGSGPFRPRQPGILIEIQTSGTTGAPKRIGVTEYTVEASLRDGVRRSSGTVEQRKLSPKSSPTLMFSPLVHTSGTFNTLMSVFEVRPIVLFEKFDPEKYRQMLVRHRPKFAPLPPTAIKMLVDSSATKEDFSSVIAVRAGTAALPVDLQQAFEEKFGVPVLTTYGATEFMGVVTSWTLDDHKQFSVAKKGSVGRAAKGVFLQIVDPANGQSVAVGETGILEAKLERIDGAKAWVRTTDIAKLDEDGFLYILGRADDAIIRGGFKIMAGRVADVLREFPGVCEAIVIGRPDERLGEVPVAVLEPYPGAGQLDVNELRVFSKQRLSPYEVPVMFHVVERLPRTLSEKISRPDVKRYLDAIEGRGGQLTRQ